VVGHADVAGAATRRNSEATHTSTALAGRPDCVDKPSSTGTANRRLSRPKSGTYSAAVPCPDQGDTDVSDAISSYLAHAVSLSVTDVLPSVVERLCERRSCFQRVLICGRPGCSDNRWSLASSLGDRSCDSLLPLRSGYRQCQRLASLWVAT
jgi:hypothetical protein